MWWRMGIFIEVSVISAVYILYKTISLYMIVIENTRFNQLKFRTLSCTIWRYKLWEEKFSLWRLCCVMLTSL